MIQREKFINKLRELGYKFTKETKRIHLWKQPGTTHRVSMPKTKLLSQAYIKTTLRQCGCDDEEIEAFFTSANG